MKIRFLALFLCVVSSWAEVDITVTANKVEEKKRNVASSVTVLDEDQIRMANSVEDLLKIIPGAEVVRSGGRGGNVAVFLRGSNSEHTLVYIDGVEANDPSSPSGTFDFANLDLQGIEKIEVIRGPQSVLYGSNAIGGVIKITTKAGEGALTSKLSFEGGSYNTFTERALVSGKENIVSYSLYASRVDTEGFSSAKGGDEDDGYGSSTVGGKFLVDLTEKTKATLVTRYNRSKTDLDNFGGSFGDDPNREIVDEATLGRFSVSSEEIADWLKQQISFSAVNQTFSDKNEPDLASIDLLDSKYSGLTQKTESLSEIKLTDNITGTLGLDHKVETASSRFNSDGAFGPFSDNLNRRSMTTNSFYSELGALISDSISLRGGGRLDDNSKFGSFGTYRLGFVGTIADTRIFSTVGTGFKAPTISQLYSSYGNQNLKEEESLGFDFGVEQSFGDTVLGVTYFRNDFDNLISFNPVTFVSENIAEAKSWGIESTASVKLCEYLSLIGSYTFTDTEDKLTGEKLLRRARHKGSIGLSSKPIEELKLDLEAILKGKRDDIDFATSERVELSGFSSVRFTALYNLDENIDLTLRAENVFDRDYEEVLGFATEGVGVYGGVIIRLD